MFNRHSNFDPPELAEDTTPSEPTPRKPAHEGKWLEPSSFASRKAQADARNAERSTPRLASMGPTEHWFKDGKNKDVYVTGELFVDVDRPTRIFVDLPGQPGLIPLFDTGNGKTDSSEWVGTFTRSTRLAGQSTGPAATDTSSPV